MNNETYCFYTSGSLLSWDEAREFCATKNSTLPIITDKNIDNVFQQFIVNDAYNVIQHRSVWLDAHARHVNDSVRWHWINGQPSDLTSSDFSNYENNWCASIGTEDGQPEPVLNSSWWTDNHHYVCQYDNNGDISSTSATNANCSPRWIVYPNSRALGAQESGSSRTQRQCLDACVNDTSCITAEWSFGIFRIDCWLHNQSHGHSHRAGITQFEIIRRCYNTSDASCDDAFQVNSSCYKVHKNERVNWFTAVNRCLSNNATLAVFNDDVRRYFPSSLLTEQAWIGLVKSWWTWPALNGTDVLYNKFNVDGSSPPDNPPQHPNTNYSCVVATSGHWKVSRCDDRHHVVCQSDHYIPPTTLPDGNVGIAVIIGVAVGVTAFVVIVIIVVVVVVVVLRRRRRARLSSTQHLEDDGEREEDSKEIYANADQVLEPSNESSNVYANVIRDDQSNGDVTSSDATYNNEPVVYTQVMSAQNRDLSDLYSNVSR